MVDHTENCAHIQAASTTSTPAKTAYTRSCHNLASAMAAHVRAATRMTSHCEFELQTDLRGKPVVCPPRCIQGSLHRRVPERAAGRARHSTLRGSQPALAPSGHCPRSAHHKICHLRLRRRALSAGCPRRCCAAALWRTSPPLARGRRRASLCTSRPIAPTAPPRIARAVRPTAGRVEHGPAASRRAGAALGGSGIAHCGARDVRSCRRARRRRAWLAPSRGPSHSHRHPRPDLVRPLDEGVLVLRLRSVRSHGYTQRQQYLTEP